MFTESFNNLGRGDVPSAGGKGAFLGELTRHGLPVPPGFVILTAAFENFLAVNRLPERIRETLDLLGKGEPAPEDASRRLRDLVLAAELPGEISGEILARARESRMELMAVRSSATAEDGADRSWAGQLESCLNVTAADLPDSVKKCWASLYSPRALAYRREDPRNTDPIGVAVVVQEMVNPEVSGIAFSVDPVTENYNEMIIEAVFGLGESIVQGLVTPDHYRVSKDPLAVLDIFPSAQERGIYRGKDGTTGWKNLDPADVSRRKLNPEGIVELGRMVMAIEKVAGFPCDIEWVYNQGRFGIVQCRPITTLSGGDDE